LIPCENCSFSPCRYRRTPYRHSLPQIEDVRLFNSVRHAGLPSPAARTVLNDDAQYSLNSRALRKWSQERLQLKFLNDGSVQARFRYEGTTCSNMGRSLEFYYDIKLASAKHDYKILELNCAPAQGDAGHMQMCEYLNNAESLMNSIETEKPLLGRPVNDVLNWKREYNPSGCYCDPARRNHKWGLVLEVIHYALVQREKESGSNHKP
jgi:hypothetical protein